MKAEYRLFAGAGAFLAVTATAYWFVTYEDAGTTMLAMGVAAVLLVAGWLLVQSRRTAPRPEDRPDASPGDGAGDVGYFPASSIWPLVIAAGAVIIGNGLVFGVWLGLTGGLLLLVGLLGFAKEASSKA